MTHGYQGLNAVYRLTGAGEWRLLSEQPADAHEETRLEMLATLCIDHISVGEEVTVEYGASCVIAQRDEQGVRVGLVANARSVNPMLMRTALKRAETRSTRGPAVSQVSARMIKNDLQASAVPAQPAGLGQSATTPNPSIPSAAEDAKVEQHSGDFDGIEFDIVFEDGSSSPVDAAEHTPEPPPVSSSARPNPTWGAAGDFISDGLTESARVLGKAVACNYWRQALRNADLEMDVDVDFRGRITAPQDAQPIPADKMTAFTQAHARWLERCRDIDPSFDFPIQRLYETASVIS